MLEESEARKLAEAAIPLVISGAARELRTGWFFPYNEIGSQGAIVHKESGRVHQLGSAFSVERDLALYDRGWQSDRYDLAIHAIHDLRATRRAVGRLPLHRIEPTSRPMTDLERWTRLDQLPCVFPAVRLYFHFEVLEEARAQRWFDFEAVEVRSAPSALSPR